MIGVVPVAFSREETLDGGMRVRWVHEACRSPEVCGCAGSDHVAVALEGRDLWVVTATDRSSRVDWSDTLDELVADDDAVEAVERCVAVLGVPWRLVSTYLLRAQGAALMGDDRLVAEIMARSPAQLFELRRYVEKPAEMVRFLKLMTEYAAVRQ